LFFFLIYHSEPFVDRQFLIMKTINEERHIFRCIEQRNGETIETFVKRLRCQAEKCDFDKSEVEQRLKDQIIDKCSNENLRKIALQVEMNSEGLISTGTILEAQNGAEMSKASTGHECTRCGFKDHDSSAPKCPAKRGHGCELCGKYGHYARMCFKGKVQEGSEKKRPRLESAGEWKRVVKKRSASLPENELKNPEKNAEKSAEKKRVRFNVQEVPSKLRQQPTANNLPTPSNSKPVTQSTQMKKEVAKFFETKTKHKTSDNGVIHIETIEVTPTDVGNETVNSAPPQAYFAIEKRFECFLIEVLLENEMKIQMISGED
jgi:hypothetical protein